MIINIDGNEYKIWASTGTVCGFIDSKDPDCKSRKCIVFQKSYQYDEQAGMNCGICPECGFTITKDNLNLRPIFDKYMRSKHLGRKTLYKKLLKELPDDK